MMKFGFWFANSSAALRGLFQAQSGWVRGAYQLFHDPVHCDYVGAIADKRSVSIELAEHVFLAVVRVQENEGPLSRMDLRLNFVHDCGFYRVPFYQRDKREQRVSFDSRSIVRSDLDINPYYSSFVHRLAEASIEDERSAMGDAGLDDNVGFDRIDDFLNTQ